MPVHIEEMHSDVSAFDGDLPLSEAQLEKLVQIILARLERKQRDAKHLREATAVRAQAAPITYRDE
jgi:hypothetical protein